MIGNQCGRKVVTNTMSGLKRTEIDVRSTEAGMTMFYHNARTPTHQILHPSLHHMRYWCKQYFCSGGSRGVWQIPTDLPFRGPWTPPSRIPGSAPDFFMFPSVRICSESSTCTYLDSIPFSWRYNSSTRICLWIASNLGYMTFLNTWDRYMHRNSNI